jgi:hypothetical protein
MREFFTQKIQKQKEEANKWKDEAKTNEERAQTLQKRIKNLDVAGDNNYASKTSVN